LHRFFHHKATFVVSTFGPLKKTSSKKTTLTFTMELPKSELEQFNYLVKMCISECGEHAHSEKLSCFAASVYPGMIAHLERITHKLYQYLLETDDCVPLFPGAGENFIPILKNLEKMAASVMRLHIPQRYMRSTGASNTCLMSEHIEERRNLRGEIQDYLTRNSLYREIEGLDMNPEEEIDQEFVVWMNLLVSISSYLLKRRENPSVEELRVSFRTRYQAHVDTYREKLERESLTYLRWTDSYFMERLDENIRLLLAYDDELWKRVVDVGYNDAHNSFCEENMIWIFWDFRDALIKNPKIESVSFENLYLCRRLLERASKIEERATAEQTTTAVTTPEIVPADLSQYPHLNLILPDIIKNNQQLLDMLIDGILKCIRLIAKGQGDVCRWSHLYRMLYDNQCLAHIDLIKTDFANAILEIIKLHGNNLEWRSERQITRNINYNVRVLSPKLPMGKNDREICNQLILNFDKRLISLANDM